MLLNLPIDMNVIESYTHNGVIIDTSVFEIFLIGLIETKFCGKKQEDFEMLISFLDLLKINDKWEKFFITPHVLTETCNHVKNKYNRHQNYKDIIKEILPILRIMEEKNVSKNNILNTIDVNNPIMEFADISICLTTDDTILLIDKITLMTCDDDIINKYQDNHKVLAINYKYYIYDLF